jgi:hypothetical protein
VNGPFLDIARDSRLIPGVHHYCDEWCDRCPHTRRCLAFRCEAAYRKLKGRSGSEPTFRNTREASEFARHVAAVEGRQTPEAGALPAAACPQAAGSRTNDPLVQTAWEYALGVSMWLVLSPEDLRQLRVGTAPSSEEVVLWFHFRIYLKLVRAMAARDQELPGRGLGDEANGCAKLTLVSVRRSRQALLHLKTEGAHGVAPFLALLERLERGIDERFPDARAFVRIGHDAPAA